MKIVLMDFSRHWGSTQSHIVAMALLLRAEERLDVHICCLANSPLALAAKAQHLPLLALSPPYSNCWCNPLHYVRLLFLTRRHRHCIFHTFSDAAAKMALRIQRKRPSGRTFIIHNCHTVHSLATRDDQGNMPLWWQQLHTVLCANHTVRKQLLNAGLDAARVIRLPAGVNTSSLPLRKSIAPQMGSPESRYIILSMTSRAGSACHSVLLKAMAALWQSESIPPWEVRIIGQCDNFQDLLDEAHALGVQSRLALLQAQPLAQVLPLGHCMVSPDISVHGSLPVMAAAWATGLPVLCPNLTTNAEWATKGKNALLYKAEDPQDLAACLKSLMTDTALFQSLVNTGLHTAPLTTQDAALASSRELYTQCILKHGWVPPAKNSAPAAPDVEDPAPEMPAAEQEQNTAAPEIHVTTPEHGSNAPEAVASTLSEPVAPALDTTCDSPTAAAQPKPRTET